MRHAPTPPLATRKPYPRAGWPAARVPVATLPGPYRRQSNDPVRRGALRFPNCARPSPGLRRYRSRRAVRPGIRSLGLKELPHGQTARSRHVRAQGRCSCLQTLSPFTPASRSRMEPETLFALNSQTIQFLFILISEWLVHFRAQRFRVLNFQELHPPADCHFALQFCRVAQDRRQQQTTLSIHLHRLAVIAGPLEQPLLGLVEAGHRAQLALDLFPLHKGIYFGTLPIPTGDVELAAVVLVEQALEFHRHFEAPFVVQSC